MYARGATGKSALKKCHREKCYKSKCLKSALQLQYWNIPKSKSFKVTPLLVNTCAFAFSMIQNILGRHFLGPSWAPSSRPFWWNQCQKNGFPSEQIWSWERGKSHMGPDRGSMGGVPKLQCSFLQKNDKYWGLCEQERYRDGAPMRWLPKGSASCHALILRDAEESLYRRLGSLFGHGVGIRNERCLEYRRTQWASLLLLTSTSLLSLALEIQNFSIHDSASSFLDHIRIPLFHPQLSQSCASLVQPPNAR